jgi:hypothetical protein
MKKMILFVMLTLVLFADMSGAKDLNTLIPGLYGGDGISLARAVPPAPDHSTHFSIATSASINRLNRRISTAIGAFPVGSSVGGFAFAFDPTLGTFVSTTETLGPLFAERVQTLGKGKFNLQFASTFFSYDRFNGRRLGHLRADALHDADEQGGRDGFRRDFVLINVNLDIDVRVFSLAATYGVTDRLDIGVFLPIASVDMKVKSRARVVVDAGHEFPLTHTFADGPESPNDAARGRATSVGDLVLRAKYRLLKSEMIDIAGAVLTTIETGDRKNFLGTGTSAIRPFLIFSRTLSLPVLPSLYFSPHLNVGYEWNLNTDDRSSIEYVGGCDIGTERFTIAGDIIGRRIPFGRLAGEDIVNASIGFKWNVWERFLLFTNIQTPLNSEGLRSDLIPTFGAEYSF